MVDTCSRTRWTGIRRRSVPASPSGRVHSGTRCGRFVLAIHTVGTDQHGLADEGLAHVPLLASPVDEPLIAYRADDTAFSVQRRGWRGAIGAWAGLIARLGHLHNQRLMRPLSIVALSPMVECPLRLVQDCPRRALQDFGLERAVEACSGAQRPGDVAGRRERSVSASPALARASHLYPVVGLIPKRRHSRRTFAPVCWAKPTNSSRNAIVDLFCHGIGLLTSSQMPQLDVSTLSPNSCSPCPRLYISQRERGVSRSGTLRGRVERSQVQQALRRRRRARPVAAPAGRPGGRGCAGGRPPAWAACRCPGRRGHWRPPGES